MTGQEMINEVRSQLRDTSIDTLIYSWLTGAVDKLASRYVFPTLTKRDAVNTTAHNPDVSLASDFNLPLIFGIPALDRTIWPISEIELATCYPKYRSTEGNIARYYLSAGTLSLWYVPETIQEIEYVYLKRASAPSDNLVLEYTDIPREWHPMICLEAIITGAKYEGDADIGVEAKQDRQELLKTLKPTLYQRPDIRHVFESNNAYRGYPQPRFGPATGWKLIGGQWVPA